MAILIKLAVVFLVVLAAVTLLLVAAIVAAAVLVTLASHYEERYRTLGRPAPGPWTWLARRLLAMPEPPRVYWHQGPQTEQLPGLERSPGPRDTRLRLCRIFRVKRARTTRRSQRAPGPRACARATRTATGSPSCCARRRGRAG
jgi:hypothetical protein